MPVLISRQLGKAALVVVGCGPTGVAGLVEAALEGMPAIGIDAGPAPLASVLAYMEGLVLASPAMYYEVGGLPLDCQEARRLTREDVLHYYARVIAHHGLDVRCGTRCVGLEPRGRHVLVRVATAGGPGWYRAERVLFTSWYERRDLDPDLLAGDHRIAVHPALQNPIQLAGRRVVILGGGLSAYEYATRLLHGGQPIVLLARGAAAPMYRHPRFQRLVAATGSAVFHGISDLALRRSRVEFTHAGTRRAVPCDALVPAIGHRLREDALRMLVRAGALSRRDCRLLRTARSYERLSREFPQDDEATLARRAAAELPDLWEQLFAGRRHIHLAGGALHPGAANGGVVFSAFSATLAVRAMAGKPPPAGVEAAPLPEYLPAVLLPETLPAALAFERVAALRPLPPAAGTPPAAPSAARPGSPPPAAIDRLLRAADGSVSVAALARRLGMTSAAQRATLFTLLRQLWWNGGLTWLPAGRRVQPPGSAARAAGRLRAATAPAPSPAPGAQRPHS